MKDISLFDKINTEKYLKDPWNKKYQLGLYFSALKEIGQHIELPIGIQTKGKLVWYKVPHAIHDGFSALKKLFKEEKIPFTLEEGSIKKPKNKIRSIFHAITSNPKTNHQYLNQNSKTQGTEYTYHYIELPSLDNALSKTAIYTNIIAKVCMEKLTLNTSSRWMIPVRIGNGHGLNASYLGIQINQVDSLQKTHQKLVVKLKNSEHWGFYYLSLFGLFLGKGFILKATKSALEKKKSNWMGSVSNLGMLGETQALEKLLILHPVRWHRPIGAILYEFNKKQYITLCLHKSLEQFNVREVLDEIKHRALKL